MKRLERITVVLYCLVAVLPFAAMKLKLRDHTIAGVLPTARYPRLSLDAFRAEKFQTGYTAWFESHLGSKGYSIAVDNTLLYHLFRDTKVGSSVMLGRDRMLFKDEDIAYFNKAGADLPDPARAGLLAERIGRMQARMREQHRAFVPVIIPSKTSIFPDKIAERWTRDLGMPRPSDVRIYRAMKRELDAHKVRYVDARELFVAGGQDRDLLWSNDARHWSYYGACLVMQEVARAYAELSGKPALPYDCPVQRHREAQEHVDYDLWKLLNLWGVLREPRLVPVVRHVDREPPEVRPSALFIGTSFQWTIMMDAERTHLFGPIHMDSYNKLLVAWPQDVAVEAHPGTAEWRELFLTKDLYILDLFEVYLFAGESYVDEILDQLETELDGADDASAPASGAAITGINDLGVTDGQHHFELWGSFPNSAHPYSATITCDGAPARTTVYYQNPKGQQLNVRVKDPGVGRCDRSQAPPRATGVSCTFRVRQGTAIGSPPSEPRRVCPGPQGKTGQDADGRCLPGLAGC